MKITRGFKDTERYEFDCGVCSSDRGYAQMDTSQDASYFGIWVNPFYLTIFSYMEGDTCLEEAASEAEFITILQNSINWQIEKEYFRGIDPGFNKDLKGRFVTLGFEKYLPQEGGGYLKWGG